jgi:hypothetical protein
MRFKGMDRNFYANGPLSTDDSRLRNVEVRYKVPSTKYNEGIESTRYLPAAGRRNTELKPMSNAERRLKNIELGKLVFSVIRPPSLVSRLLVLGSCFLKRLDT